MIAVFVVLGVGAYLAFITAIIVWASRRQKRKLDANVDAVKQGLVTAGARAIGAPRPGVGLTAGQEQELDFNGRRLWASTAQSGKHHTRLNLRTIGGPYPSVVVFPEGKVERFGKHVGLNHEVQTGDRAFDDAAYIDTVETNDEYVLRLLGTADVRDGVRALLGLGFRVEFSPNGVVAFRLSLNSKPVDTTDLGKAAEALGRVAEHAPAFRTETLVAPGKLKAGLLGIVSVVGFILAAGFAGGMGSLTDRTLDGGDQFFAYIVLGGFVWMLVVIAAGAWVKGTSSAMSQLLIVGLFGLIGIPAGVGSLALGLNQWLDDSHGELHNTYVRKLRRNKSNYSIRVDSWRDDSDGLEKIKTSYAKWQTLKVGDRVDVRAHPGAFGWPWADKLE